MEIAGLPTFSTWIANEGFASNAVEIVRISGGQLAGTAAVALRFDSIDAVDSTSQNSFHDADTDRDMSIGLSELLRVIELYNTRLGTSRTGCYGVADGTADGFEPDSETPAGTTPELSRYHSGDSDRNAEISLSELLRVIEIYNYREGTSRTGQYRLDPTSVDGFAPGPGTFGRRLKRFRSLHNDLRSEGYADSTRSFTRCQTFISSVKSASLVELVIT